MRKTRLILLSVGTLLLTVPQMTGCSDIDKYEINAPEDLYQKIDSIAEAKASKNKEGD